MDRSDWQPWAWGAGAVVCGLLLCRFQPWRQQFCKARKAWLTNRWLWAAPMALTAGELIWQWQMPAEDSGSLLHQAGLRTGDSLAMILTWILRGDVPSMILAAALLANSAGLRRGLWSGITSTFPPGWAKFFQLLLIASATAALGLPAVRFGAGGETGSRVINLLAAPWSATAATILLCWLILAFETVFRKPEKTSGVRWVEMTGLYTARLWLPAAAGTLLFPVFQSASAGLMGVFRACAWPVAALLAWFPYTALRSTEAGEIHTVFHVALRRWVTGFVPFSGWLITAAVHLCAFHLLSLWLISLCPPNTPWRTLTAGLLQTGWAALAVFMLGAWIAIQVDSSPTATKDARSARKSRQPV